MESWSTKKWGIGKKRLRTPGLGQSLLKWPSPQHSKHSFSAVRTPVPVSYATYQVHFTHEQSQVISPDSLVTIGTIQQTQDAACFAYIDTIVGMRLDQPSYRFMEICWKNLALSLRHLNGWIKLNIMNNPDVNFHEYLLKWSYTGNVLYALPTTVCCRLPWILRP